MGSYKEDSDSLSAPSWIQRRHKQRQVQNVLQQTAHNCHLPPVNDPLRYHVARANYQAYIWHRSLDADAQIPNPDNHGWDVTDSNISIHWMDKQPTPRVLLQLICCNSRKDHCVVGRCSSQKSALPCTDDCGCTDCNNSHNTYKTKNDSSDEG